MAIVCEYHSNFADARIKSAGAFARADWFAALHAACLADHPPLIAHVCDGEAQMWMALMRDGAGRLAAMANYYSFFWAPVWSGAEHDEGAKARLLAAWAQSLRGQGQAHALTLSPMPEAEVEPLCAALRNAGWLVRAENSSANHWLDTGGRSFADWWAARPGALRSTVQRKTKKGLVATAILSQFDERGWGDFEAVYRDSWKPAESHPNFLHAWARTEGEAGRLRLGLAHIDGHPVAAQFWTVEGGTAYIHKLAHRSGQDALSPGTLLTHALFAHAFDVDKVARIDFGTGDDGYKRDWMEESAPLCIIRAWRPQHPANWPQIGRAMLSLLAARLRRR